MVRGRQTPVGGRTELTDREDDRIVTGHAVVPLGSPVTGRFDPGRTRPNVARVERNRYPGPEMVFRGRGKTQSATGM